MMDKRDFLKGVTTMKCVLWFTAFIFFLTPAFSQIKLECDFSSTEDRRNPMHYHWGISNRISPMKTFNQPVGENPLINVVRPLGGKSKDDKKVIAEDTYKWDGEKYIYDWEPLKMQIDTVSKTARLYQLLIDNAPWAFQRGIDFNGEDEVETYGNAWPPNDPKAWSLYIQAMLTELVDTYGRDQVEQWRYCIGREIGTGGHWRGTKMDFFEHYKNTEKAIRSILPNAKVGTHFLWASSKHSFGPDFVVWCKENEVRYDFIGVSYYPFYDKVERVDPDHVYEVDFAPIKDIPEWNANATLELHEFALITSMSKKGNSFKNASKGHQASFTVMLAKMMYEHDMVDIFRWGTGENKEAEKAFLEMKGNIYYSSSKEGAPKSSESYIDAVFALDENKHQYNIIAYHYNAKPEFQDGESVKMVTTLPVPPKSEFDYRIAVCEAGDLEWSDWNSIQTVGGNGTDRSELELTLELASFSFQKIELRPSQL